MGRTARAETATAWTDSVASYAMGDDLKQAKKATAGFGLTASDRALLLFVFLAASISAGLSLNCALCLWSPGR